MTHDVMIEPLVPRQCQEKAPLFTCLECHEPLAFQRRSKQFCNNTCCQRYRRRERARPVGAPDVPVLHYGRFEDYADRYAGAIDVIITDPPYARKALPIYAALAQFALATLVPGGWLLCLSGSGIDYEVRTLFNTADLEYLTTVTYFMPGGTAHGEKKTSTGMRYWNQQAKPLLWYQKRGTKRDHRRAGSSDVIGNKVVGKNRQNRKEFKWQQDPAAFQQLVGVFTNKYDVLCDPCMGSGTTILAALAMGRQRVIGIEKDRDTYTQATTKVQDMQRGIPGATATQPPLFAGA